MSEESNENANSGNLAQVSIKALARWNPADNSKTNQS